MTTNTEATKAGDFKCPKCGWLARIDGGCAVCTPPAEPALAGEGAKPVAWVTPLRYGEQVTFYRPPAPAPGEDDEWYCYPLFRHPAPSACGVADSAAESDPCPHCEGSGRSACWNCDGTGRRHDNIRDSFNLAHAQSADRWDGKHWLEGTAGGCNIVTYNGEDVVGVGYIANDNAREQVIADHNARLDAQSADTPSEAPVAWQRRCDGGEWLQCSREQYEHTVRRGNAGVVGDNAEARALYASRPQPARGEVSDATKVIALALAHIANGIPNAKEVAADALSQAAALEAAARVRADHFVDANKKVGDAK